MVCLVRAGAYSEHAFFPLWLGYILAVDGLTMRRAGTSLLARDQRRFASLFIFRSPSGGCSRSPTATSTTGGISCPGHTTRSSIALLASLAFSTVMPAIFVTAELLRTFSPFARIAAGSH